MDFIPFTILDFVDILLVALLMFGIYRMTRGTNAPYIFTGIIVIYVVWVVVRALNMTLLQTILGQIVSVGVIALLIIFQPEIRSFLQVVGMRQRGFTFINHIFHNGPAPEIDLEPVVTACSEMSLTKTGALIVLAQKSDLRDIIDNGIKIDAQVSVALLGNIFFKNAPLHDGAVIINGNRVVAAKCVLPSTQQDVPKSYGMRHRAALGMSEVSDAIVIAVSEETGRISLAHDSQIKRNIEPQNLASSIRKLMRKNDKRREEDSQAD